MDLHLKGVFIIIIYKLKDFVVLHTHEVVFSKYVAYIKINRPKRKNKQTNLFKI